MTSRAINKQFNALGAFKLKPRITEFQFMDIYSDIHPFKETAILLG